jgi:hypothetical protein
MKAYKGVDVLIHIFLASALAGCEWSASRPCRFTPGTHWIGGCVTPEAVLDNMENRKFLPPPGLELRPLGRPACSQLLYRLSKSLQYPLNMRLVGPQNRSRSCVEEKNILPLPVIEPQLSSLCSPPLYELGYLGSCHKSITLKI